MGRRVRERERDVLHHYSTTDRTAHMTPVPSSLFSSNKRTRYDPQAHVVRTRYAYTETTLRFKEGAAVSMKIIPSHIILPHQHRFLTENDDVWSQNAWDHVPAPADQDATIAASLARQRATPVPDDDKPKYNTRPAKHWSVPIPSPISTTLLKGNCDIGTTFTKRTPQTFSRTASGAFFACSFTLHHRDCQIHRTAHFFQVASRVSGARRCCRVVGAPPSISRNRNTIRPPRYTQAGPRTVVEIGCGASPTAPHTASAGLMVSLVSYVLPDCRPHPYIDVGAGNAIFPLLEQNCNHELHIHAFDYSSHAVKLVQVRPILRQSISTDPLICCDDHPSTTLCTYPHLVERSLPRSGTCPLQSFPQASRLTRRTFSSSCLSSALYTPPNGPVPSPISPRCGSASRSPSFPPRLTIALHLPDT